LSKYQQPNLNVNTGKAKGVIGAIVVLIIIGVVASQSAQIV